MRHSGHHSLAGRFPVVLGFALLLAPVALFSGACGGTTEDELSGTSGGAGGQAGSGTAGSGGSSGTVGDGGSAGAATAGSGGSTAGNNGEAGSTTAGSGGSTAAGSGGSGGSALAGSGGASTTSPCAACIQDKCKDQLAACDADPNCSEIGKCVLDQCLESTSQNELIQCAFSTCGAGINNQALLPVAQCAQQQCDSTACPFASGGGGTGGTGAGGASDPGAAPGVITCGPNLACDLEKDGACCITVAGLQGPEYTCTKKQCSGGFISIPQPCDGPEDCKDGEICCGAASQQAGANVVCATQCDPPPNGQAFQFCHKDGDCADGETCQVCDVGQFGISITFRVCGTQCPNLGGGGPGGP